MRDWKMSLLTLSAVVAAGCTGDESGSNEDADAENVGEVAQAETEPCPATYAATAATINYDKEIVITAKEAVDDICRTTWNSADPSCTTATKNKWHFWYLMQQMAGSGNVTRFILRWLESYNSWPDPVNGQTLQTRTNVQSGFINKWMTATNTVNGNSACVLDKSIDDPLNINCQLDPGSTPLRLLAIVNRTDLRSPGVVGGYGGGSAGEGRFIFGFTRLATSDNNSIPPGKPQPAQAVVILEYKLPTPVGWNPKQWAQKWRALGTTGTGFDATYRAALQTLTDKWTAQFNISGGLNKGTSIGQVRMNDFEFDQGHFDPILNQNIKVWSLREFKLGCPLTKTCTTDTQWLIPVTVAQTPASVKNNSNDLANFITDNSTAILDELDSYVVPEAYNNSPFLGAESSSTSKFSMFGPVVWTYPGYDPMMNPDDADLRRRMAFVTCNGCHYAETETNNLHMANRSYGKAATPSNFVRQQITTTSDPSGNSYSYDEPARRKCELAALQAGKETKVFTTTGRIH